MLSPRANLPDDLDEKMAKAPDELVASYISKSVVKEAPFWNSQNPVIDWSADLEAGPLVQSSLTYPLEAVLEKVK